MNWLRWLGWSLALNAALWSSFAAVLGRSSGVDESRASRMEVTRVRAGVRRTVSRSARGAQKTPRLSTPNRSRLAPRQTRSAAILVLRPVATVSVRRRKISRRLTTKPFVDERFKPKPRRNLSSTNDFEALPVFPNDASANAQKTSPDNQNARQTDVFKESSNDSETTNKNTASEKTTYKETDDDGEATSRKNSNTNHTDLPNLNSEETQLEGNNGFAPESPNTKPKSTPTPIPTPRIEPTPTPRPLPTSTPKPLPTPTPRIEPTPTPRPLPLPTPKTSGATRDAIATRRIVPRRVPERLKREEFRASVRVRVSVDESGNATNALRQSSGNALVDEWILETLGRWRWKPALRGGEPVSSSQNFRFDLEVR